MLQEQATLLDFATRVYPAVLQHDLLRYIVGAGGTFLVVNVLLARYLAARQIRQVVAIDEDLPFARTLLQEQKAKQR